MKKVFPKIPGTEITINFINRYGNKEAVVINDKGLPLDPKVNPNIELDSLKISIAKNVRSGLLVVKEVNDAKKESNIDAKLLDEFNSLIKPKKETPKKENIINNKPNTKKQPIKTEPVKNNKTNITTDLKKDK